MKSLIFKNHLNYKFISRMFKWHMNYYLFGKGSPISAGVYISDKCNCRCIMCNLWKDNSNKIYPWELQKKAIDLLSNNGCYYYSISGGEPTLVNDLTKRLTYAASKIPYVHVVTNGLNMTNELAAELSKTGIKEISVSMDGMEDIHNLFRGREDAFKKAWNALDILKEKMPQNTQIVVNSILTRYNLDSLRELRIKLDEMDINQKYLPVSFHGLFFNSEENTLKIKLPESTNKEIMDFIDEAIQHPKIVNSMIFLKKAKRYFNGQENIIPEQKKCLYPFHSAEINASGKIFPCITGMDFSNGFNIDNGNVFKSHEYKMAQKKLISCKKCNGSMMVCYYEPRLNFPITSLIRSYFTR